MTLEIKATGPNASGKTRTLNKIKPFLESEGLSVSFSNEDEHKLIVQGGFDEKEK